VALALPPAHIFEGLRALVTEGVLDVSHLAWAFGLNVLWLGGGVLVFAKLLRASRDRGALTQIGE